MASNSTGDWISSPDRYDLVSSIYGPGTTGCWYLTALSCLAAWTLHPKRRVSGSIDPDFIALLTFPVVAAGHLITQIYAYPGSEVEKTERASSEDISAFLKLASSLEASLIVIETYMAICVVLLLIAIWFRCIKRALLLALSGLFCFSVEGYLLLATPSKHYTIIALGRPFLWNFVGMFITATAFLGVLILFALALTIMFYIRRLPATDAGMQEPGIPLELEVITNGRTNMEIIEDLRRALHSINRQHLAFRSANRKYLESRNVCKTATLTMWFLPLGFLLTLIPMSIDILSVSASGSLSWLYAVGNRLIEDIFPHTNASIRDLDQAVAALAGTTVLGFSLYGSANAHYRIWLDKNQRWRDRDSRESYYTRTRIRLERALRLQMRMAHDEEGRIDRSLISS